MEWTTYIYRGLSFPLGQLEGQLEGLFVGRLVVLLQMASFVVSHAWRGLFDGAFALEET